MGQWQIVFFISAGVYIFCGTFYNAFGSGERQPWDNPMLDKPEPSSQQNGNYPLNVTVQAQTTDTITTTTTTPHANGNGVHESKQ